MPEQVGETETGECVAPKKRVALFDVDRTLTEQAITLDFIEAQAEVGVTEYTDGLKQAVDNMGKSLVRGRYEDRLSKLLIEHAKTLQGIPRREVVKHADEFYSRKGLFLPYVEPTFEAFRSYGYSTYLVSAGPDFSVESIASVLSANGAFSSVYGATISKSREEVFSGEVISDLATIGRKAKAALEIINWYSPDCSYMLADSIADVGALSVVENPFCVNPSQDLINVAQEPDIAWPIIPVEILRNERVPLKILGRLLTQGALQT